MSSTAVIDFAPKEKVTYSKEVQTMAIETEDFPEEKKGDDGSADTLASGVAAITLKDEKHVEIQPEPAPAPPKPRGACSFVLCDESWIRFSTHVAVLYPAL